MCSKSSEKRSTSSILFLALRASNLQNPKSVHFSWRVMPPVSSYASKHGKEGNAKTWIVAQTLGSNTAAMLWTGLEIRSSIHNSSRQMQTNITCHHQYHDIYIYSVHLHFLALEGMCFDLRSWWWFDKPISVLSKKRTLACSRCCTEGLQESVCVHCKYTCHGIGDSCIWAFGTGSFIIMIPQKEFVLLESRLPCYHRVWYHIINFAGRGKHCKNWSCCAYTNSVRSTLQFLQWEDGMKHVEHLSWAQSSICTCKKTWTIQLLRLCSFNVQPYYVSDIVEVNEARNS